MRIAKDVRHKIRNACMIKVEILSLIISMFIYFFYRSRYLINTAPNNIEVSILDILCMPTGGGIIGSISLSFPIIPVFVFITIRLLDFENNDFYLLRLKSRIRIWNSRVKFIMIISFIYSLSIVSIGYLIGGIVCKSFENNWTLKKSIIYNCINDANIWSGVEKNITTDKILVLNFIGLFLGIYAIGLLASVLKSKLRNIYVYLIISILLFSDATQDMFSIIIGQMTIGIEEWIKPTGILLNYIYMICISIMLYFIGKSTILNKDFISEELEEKINE